MKNEFWLERWEQGLTGFHRDEVNPYLEKWIEHAQLKKGAAIFVPLCGKSLDLLWLASLGYKVIGIELAPLAIEEFISEHNLKTQVREMDDFAVYSVNNLRMICGDYFKLKAEHLGKVDFIFDRAALIAMPSDMRPKYIEHMRQLVPYETTTLLITLDYDQSEMTGPPFSVAEDEVRQYFTQATLLESVDVLPEHQKFKDRGVTRLYESVWYLGRL